MTSSIIFFGTPEEAVPFLKVCLRDHAVPAVITQPDRPAGRGLKPAPPAVKKAAQELGLNVLQPEKPGQIAAELEALHADLAVVVAYGKFLPPSIISAPRLGCLNVHFSLLPKYRGAAPVTWALIRGETQTGVTLFWIDEGMDSGPMQRQAAIPISPEQDASGLTRLLVELGVRELDATLAELAAGNIRRDPQVGEPSLAPKIKPEQAHLTLHRPASELHQWARALMHPRPYWLLNRSHGRMRVCLLKTELESARERSYAVGTVVRVERDKGFLVQCLPGLLWVLEVQPEGKKKIAAADFLNGLRLKPGDCLLDV